MKDIIAAAVQFEHEASHKDKNWEKIRAFAASAHAQHVELLVFPEMCITGYWHIRKLSREDIQALAEPIPFGPSTQELLSLATRYSMTVGAGLIECAEDGTLYNAYVVAMPDGSFAKHRKLHCFVSAHMASGDSYTVFDLPQGARAGVLTCYDNNIGENVRINALKGVEILLAPHQTGGCDSPDPNIMGLVDRTLWENRQLDPQAIEDELRGPKGRGWLMRWLPARAHDNGVFLIFSNGVGVDDDEIRTGNAMILDPYGRILAETGKAGDDMVVAKLDASLLETSTGRRWITTRRPELYELLTVPTGLEQDTRTVRFDKKGV